MNDYPSTPQELLRQRFDWLRDGAFEEIYSSYHSEARFHEVFTSEEEYQLFAREQGLSGLELEELVVLDETVRGKLARILTYQAYHFAGQLHCYLDITTMRRQGDRWYVLFGKRVECDAHPALDRLGWDAVDKHPEALQY